MKKLKNHFGIEKVICQGGPTTNELLLKANLIEKLIIVKIPFILQPGSLHFWEMLL